jgi:hypothetical protein
VLYSGPNFTGRRITVDQDLRTVDADMSQPGSVQVLSGRWQLCDRAGYAGNCVTVTDSIRDTSQLVSLRGRVASIRQAIR